MLLTVTVLAQCQVILHELGVPQLGVILSPGEHPVLSGDVEEAREAAERP